MEKKQFDVSFLCDFIEKMSIKAEVMTGTIAALEQAIQYGRFSEKSYEWVFSSLFGMAHDMKNALECMVEELCRQAREANPQTFADLEENK